MMFKELVQNEPDLSFDQKEQIFDKLLDIVSEGVKATQQQQYKQAYALKALMWMREEAIGLQECFELTHKVMRVYADSEMEGHDSTVELYLLNFWSKELSYRDLCDRISHCVLSVALPAKTNYSNFTTKLSSEMDSKQIDLFNCLFDWFVKARLFPEKQPEDPWEISDLRKIVLPLCQAVIDNRSVRHQVPKDFILRVSKSHGEDKLRTFIEVQLIQKPELFARFTDWLDSAKRVGTADSKKNLPKVLIDRVAGTAESDKLSQSHVSSQQSLLKQHTPRGGVVESALSYKERRDQHKSKIAGNVTEF